MSQAIIIDGKAIAAEVLAVVKAQVAARSLGAPQLVAITCAPNFATEKYLALKERVATSAGISLRVERLSAVVTTEMVIAAVQSAAQVADGVVVQLPLPPHVDREAVLAAVPRERDPDGFSYGQSPKSCLPPVVGAIAEIVTRESILLTGRRAVVLGHGRLVGAPVAIWLRSQGAHVTVYNNAAETDAATVASAEILVTGVGQPALITPSQVADGVIIFDAGASEDGGLLVGDVHEAVAEKASLFTPVPGGIGPITVAKLMQNLLELTARQ